MRDEAQDDCLGAILAVGDDDAFLDQRLGDGLVDVREHIAQLGQRDDDLGGNDRRAQALDPHQAEALLPLVLGDLIGQHLPLVGSDDRRQAGQR